MRRDPMDAARWEEVQALFHQALELPSDAQAAFLDRACGDAALRAKVAALIEADAQGESLIDRDIAQVASDVLGTTPSGLGLPERFGRYRIRSVLGEGGMGIVYLAERIDVGGFVALKVLRDAWLSPARRERFANEQRTLAQLTHPSIARFYDADTLSDGTPWLVMEYVEGLALAEYCAVHRLSMRQCLTLVRAVADAVQYAHQHLVIHRDLKPSNILVRADGRVALLDFGIAKQLETVSAPGNETRTGMRFMTPAYAAPEQIGGGQTGIHTDVYSLGVVLYELLTSRLPYDLADRSPLDAEVFIREHEAVRPSAVARRVAEQSQGGSYVPIASARQWADLDVLCLTAMHKDPLRRYRSVEAFIRDIDHYLEGRPLEARPDSLAYRMSKFAARYRRPIAGAALALAALVAVVTAYTLRLRTARAAAVAESARTARIERFMLNIFSGGDEAAGPSDTLHVVTMVGRGLQEARALGNEPAVQADLYATLGGIYQKLGNFERADTLLEASLARRRAMDGPDQPDVVSGLVALALLRSDEANYPEAEHLVREGLTLGARRLPPTNPVMVQATIALGEILENRGAYDSAIEVLNDGVARAARAAGGTDTAALAAGLTELANSDFYAGRLVASDAINRRVLVMDRRLYGDRHPHVADDLINLGAIQNEIGRYADAERYYHEALDIDRAWYGSSHPEVASVLTMIGRTLVAEKRAGDAVPLLQQALAIQERTYGPVHPRVASALNALGLAGVEAGALDSAQADFTRMASIYRSVYGEKHYLLGIASSDLGSVADSRHEYATAERLFRDAVQRLTASLSADHLSTGVARLKLGRVLLHEGRFAEAEPELRAGAAIVAKQPHATATYLAGARADLIAVYDSLHEPAKAAAVAADPLAASR